MKLIAVLGIVLVVLGLGGLVYQGITYTTRETIVDVGPIHATAERQKTVPLPPVLGITAVVGGMALLIVGIRKRA
jgi:multisubunit Na+/H+ antiporter MnhC subunit